jgi:DeoR family transcriptional regulator, glycerol-3-phosphate regulon repressor
VSQPGGRRAEIVTLVQRQGFVTIEALAQHFEVTPQTIRRDINELAEEGVLQRHHGGAALPSSVQNIAYSSRQVLHLEAKRQIARAVARNVPDNASLSINIGTTNEEIAKALMRHEGLSVITNNLNVANIMAANEAFQVIVAGGVVRARDRGIVGEATIDSIRQFRVDIAVIGISAIDLDGTLLDFDYREVKVAQTIIRHARRVFLAADHSKIGRPAMARLGDMTEIDSFFTDLPPPDELQAALAAAGTTLVVADEEQDSS